MSKITKIELREFDESAVGYKGNVLIVAVQDGNDPLSASFFDIIIESQCDTKLFMARLKNFIAAIQKNGE
jgi:hypothetical protein